MIRGGNSLKFIVFFIIATAVLFLGFYRNQWGVVRDKKFKNFQRDSESLVMARLVETRQHGLFSYGGLMGWGDVNSSDLNEEDYTYQYDAYLKDWNFKTYSIYKSQTGLQSMLFGLMDQISPFSAHENLRLFRVLTSLLYAGTLGFFLALLFEDYGWLVSLVTVTVVLASPWLTLFGRNLFYSSAFFFLPMVVLYYFLARENKGAVPISDVTLGWWVFLLVTLKCLFSGYDLIIPTLGMLATPVVQFAIQGNWGLKKFSRRSLFVGLAAAAAIFMTLTVLTLQIWAATGSLSEGVTHIVGSFGRRASGDPDLYPLYADSLKVSVWTVLQIYLTGDTALAGLSLRFSHLISIFALFTGIYFLLEHFRKGSIMDVKKARGLVGATWFSILSPLSWYTVFKGLAYIHTHTNFVAWYMPFVLFGFALCEYVITLVFQSYSPLSQPDGYE